MIKVNNVWHHYGIRPILKDVSMEVKAGELVAVMGPNGMGKSTLLGVIAGILKSLADRNDVTVVMAVPVPELVEGLAHRIAIVARGQLLAYDTPANLLHKSEKAKDLSEVLEELLHPEMFDKIDQYLGGMI